MWPYILSLVGISAMWLAGLKRWQGWALGLVCEALWVVYALSTHQYGFIFGSVTYSAVYLRNLWRWRDRPPPPAV